MDTGEMHSYSNSYKIDGITDNPPVDQILKLYNEAAI